MVRKNLRFFLNSLNEFDPCIMFTYESNKESIALPDIRVSLRNGKVFTDLYFKPTDRHQYLHYLSLHPYHTKKSVVFSRTLQISKLCSSKRDLEYNRQEMKSRFRKRDYPENLIRFGINKIKSNFRPKNNNKNHDMKGIPLVVTYRTLLKSLSGIIDKNLSILYMDKEIKNIFTPQPMDSLCSPLKLNSSLVTAKLNPLERTVGSFKCKGKRRRVCNNITEAIDR